MKNRIALAIVVILLSGCVSQMPQTAEEFRKAWDIALDIGMRRIEDGAMDRALHGHEQPVYPSYYPHEIEIRTIAPEPAADLMRAGKLHAYIGTVPHSASAPPDTIGTVESLGSFVVVRLNPESSLARDETMACATTRAILREMAAKAGTGPLIVHPYPVTPWHGDYLNHIDRAEAARRRFLEGDAPPSPGHLKLRTRSELATSIIRPEWLATGVDWDAAFEKYRDQARGADSAEDAHLAVEHGVDGVVVSNHGARQLDRNDPALAAAPGVVRRSVAQTT